MALTFNADSTQLSHASNDGTRICRSISRRQRVAVEDRLGDGTNGDGAAPATLSHSSSRKPLRFEISKTMMAVLKNKLTVSHTHIHPFNGPLSGTTRVGRYQKGKTNLDFTEARDSEWQWHQLDHMQVCISLQTDNNASTPPLNFFTGRMPFLPPNQQRQSTEGK